MGKLEKRLICVIVVLAVLVVGEIIGVTLVRRNADRDDTASTETENMLQIEQIPGFDADVINTEEETEPSETEEPEETETSEATTAPTTSKSGSGGNSNSGSSSNSGGSSNSGNSNSGKNSNSGGSSSGGSSGKDKPDSKNNGKSDKLDNTGTKKDPEDDKKEQDSDKKEQDDTQKKPTEPVVDDVPTGRFSDENLYLEALGGYSGNYLEDGSDELVSNVAAILVTNTSDEMLQVSQIVFQVGDGEVAQFQVSNLPAGESALVLEQQRRPYSSSDDYSYGQAASAYIEAPSMQEDKVNLDTDNAGELTLTNVGDEEFSQAYVYYKYVQEGGAYLGGITYRVTFENVAPGESVTLTAGHFHPSNSEIMGVDVKTGD